MNEAPGHEHEHRQEHAEHEIHKHGPNDYCIKGMIIVDLNIMNMNITNVESEHEHGKRHLGDMGTGMNIAMDMDMDMAMDVARGMELDLDMDMTKDI